MTGRVTALPGWSGRLGRMVLTVGSVVGLVLVEEAGAASQHIASLAGRTGELFGAVLIAWATWYVALRRERSRRLQDGFRQGWAAAEADDEQLYRRGYAEGAMDGRRLGVQEGYRIGLGIQMSQVSWMTVDRDTATDLLDESEPHEGAEASGKLIGFRFPPMEEANGG